jgi:GAF domain-containing protein
MQALLIASFLHDIGKLGIPEYIINKPGKLTPEEFEKMKIHPVVGADILERVRFPYPVVPIVRSHHEAWDGSGYPDGLKGEEIPIGARLLTAVDCFDAIASDRPYRRALPLDEAIAFVKSRAGVQFDPQIVDLLGRHYRELEEKARRHIDELAPLNTDLLIQRGAAPGAGFEPERCTGEAQVMFELGQMPDGPRSVRDTSSALSGHLRKLIAFDCLAVYLKSGESLAAQLIDSPGFKAFSMLQIPIGTGLSGWVAENARAIINGNPTVEPNYLTESGSFTASGSALSIPLFDPSGAVFGVLTLYSAAVAAFSKDHLRILQTIEPRFSIALQNAVRFGDAMTEAKISSAFERVAAR